MIGIIPDDRYLRRGFSALQMLYWCSVGSSSTYIVSYVTAVRGMSASMTGLMLAVFMLCGCIGQFIINPICDKKQNNRLVFQMGIGLSLLLWWGVYFSPNIILLFVLNGLLGLLQPTMSAVLDTWLIRSFPNDPGAYSPIRSLGSLSYSCLMLVMGFAIDGIGHVVMLILPTLFSVGGIIMARLMPEIPQIARQDERGEHRTAGLRALSPAVIMFVVIMAGMGIANMPLLNMNLLIMENAGGSVTNQGIAIAFNTVAEFLTMRFFMRGLKRLSANRQLLFAGLLYVVSTIIILTLKSIPALYIAFFINGVGYGVLMPARRQFVNESVDERLMNRMHGVGDMAYNSLGGLVGNQCSGMVIDHWGVSTMVGISLALESVSFGLLAVMNRLKRQENS